jgi:hypothetical protein
MKERWNEVDGLAMDAGGSIYICANNQYVYRGPLCNSVGIGFRDDLNIRGQVARDELIHRWNIIQLYLQTR